MIKKTTNLILYFIGVLLSDTDFDHPLSVQEMIDRIGQKYCEVNNVKLKKGEQLLTRQTLHKYIADINRLYEKKMLDVYIEKKGSRYYIERNIHEYQLDFLTHALIALGGNNAKHSDELLESLKKIQSSNFIQSFELNNIFEVAKKDNARFFNNLELVLDAITNHQRISYNYLCYKEDGALEKMYQNSKILYPLGIVAKDDHFFVIGLSSKLSTENKDRVHLRIDRLTDLKKSRLTFKTAEFNSYEYMRPHIYNLSKDVEEFIVQFDKSLLDEVLDTFSDDLKIKKGFKDAGYIAKLKTSEKEMMMYATKNLGTLEVLAPEKTRQKIKESLNHAARVYDSHKNAPLKAFLLAKELLSEEEIIRLDHASDSLKTTLAKTVVYLFKLDQKGLLDTAVLKKLRPNAKILKALEDLHKMEGEDETSYLLRVSQNELALEVLKALTAHDPSLKNLKKPLIKMQRRG